METLKATRLRLVLRNRRQPRARRAVHPGLQVRRGGRAEGRGRGSRASALRVRSPSFPFRPDDPAGPESENLAELSPKTSPPTHLGSRFTPIATFPTAGESDFRRPPSEESY